MPYKYIGRTSTAVGKSLWEIVGNLKNYGVGRIVTRGVFERYEEPTYYKILKVSPMNSPVVQNIDNMRRVRVEVERTFRGRTDPCPVFIELVSYKTDYRLIPKDEEAAYCKPVQFDSKLPVFPKYMEFPPLLKEMLRREQLAKDALKTTPKLEVKYNPRNYGKYRIADEGETPDFLFEDQEIHSSMYKDVKSQSS